MERVSSEPASTRGPPREAAQAGPAYQPPAVEWEEEFEPVATSCVIPDDCWRPECSSYPEC
jgi:hypothetical protein